MQLSFRRVGNVSRAAIALAIFGLLPVTPCGAITLNQTDDFDDGTKQNWSIGQDIGDFPMNVADPMPSSVGDKALLMATFGAGGSASKLLVLNGSQTQGTTWGGSWTTAGVTRITMDVLNPNGFQLQMRLGIVGEDGLFGNRYITSAIPVPTGGAWHSIAFDVLADDWIAISGDTEIATALTDVRHLRVLHNPDPFFQGAEVAGRFYLDNIKAAGAASTGVLGDYNGNDEVDAADYAVWRDNPASLINEGASLGVVDHADYEYWRSRFGATSGAGAGAGSVSVATGLAVPEPASWVFMTGLFVFAWVLVRKRV